MSTLNVNNINEAGGVDAVITSGVLDSGSLPAGSVLQVVQATKTDTFSTTSTSFTDVTGLSASITPRSTSSKILVIMDIAVSTGTAENHSQVKLLRDSTDIYVGDAAGSRTQAAITTFSTTTELRLAAMALRQNATFLDSPSTTSAVTYKAQARVSTDTFYVNRSAVDSDSSTNGRLASSITLMEVAG